MNIESRGTAKPLPKLVNPDQFGYDPAKVLEGNIRTKDNSNPTVMSRSDGTTTLSCALLRMWATRRPRPPKPLHGLPCESAAARLWRARPAVLSEEEAAPLLVASLLDRVAAA